MKRNQKTAEESEDISESEAKSKKFKNNGKNDDTVDEDESEKIEADVNFNMRNFHHDLKFGNFSDDLKHFIKKASQTPALIQEFVESGGKILEIVEIIKKNEDSSLEIVSNLYHLLQLMLFYIVNDDNQRIDPSVQALKFLVNRSKVSIEKMLASSKTTDKVLILKVLSIATSLDSDIGREILKNIEVFAKSTDKNDFSILEDNKKKKISYDQTVRIAFVHFILGFLFNDKDIILRKKILQKRSLFEFFLRDIHQDNFEAVKSVITCLTKNVLISPAFSKPEKLKIFTDNTIKSLLKLYEWKGEASEKASVMNITHQFLLLLLTSKKHGIVFKALSEKRQNLRQLEVINLFKNVWNYEYPSMLVIEIIKSCPDLMQNLLNRLVMSLQPKVTTNWFMCANFTIELIKAMEPSTMINSFSMLEPKKISANIIKLSISQFILQNVNERALIQHDSLEIRETSVHLLYLMLNKCCNYLDEVKKISTLKDFEKHRIKFDIINHIFTFFPNINIILNSLYRSINLSTKKKSDDSEKLVKSQLKHTLEILLLVIQNFPSIIEKIPSVIDYLEVLRPIYEYQLSASDDIDKNENLEMEMKVVKIILFLQPDILSLESEIFKRIFLVLIQVYCCSSNEKFRVEANVLLKGVLHNTMIFQSHLEISIWLEGLKSVKRGILKESASTFIKALRLVKIPRDEDFTWSNQDVVKYDINLLEKIDVADLSKTSENTEMNLSQVLPALLMMKPNIINRVIEFVEIAMILFYHSYPQQKKSFLKLLDSEYVELNTKVGDYIKKKSLTDFGEKLEMYLDLAYRKFQLALINEEKVQIIAEDVQTLELLIIQGVFCATQMNISGKLTEEKSSLLKWYIEDFYKQLLKAEKNDKPCEALDALEKVQIDNDDKKVNKICELRLSCPSQNVVNSIFNNQTLLLDEFSIAKPNQLTKFIAQLADIFSSTDDFGINTKNFRCKIINELKDVSSSAGHHDEIFKVIEKFPFDASDCALILDVLVKQKGSTKEFHIKLLDMIIKRLTCLKTSPLSAKLIHKVENIYVDAAANTAIDLIAFETSFLSYLMTFNHNIGDLSNKILLLAFREDQGASRSFVRLICDVFTRKNDWNEIFKADVMKLKKELMYPLLGVALIKQLIPGDQLKPIYQEFKSGIIKTIEKPNKAAQIYRENILTSLKLIELAMPLNECQDLATKKFKFESTEIYQLKMLHGIFTKTYTLNQDEKTFKSFLNHWFHLFSLSVAKSQNVNEEYLEVLGDWMEKSPADTIVSDSDDRVNGTNWETFYKLCLKNGLKSAESSKMLVLLGKVIRFINVIPDEVATILDMILTHSNFFHVVFNFKSSGNTFKRNLFYLLNILVQKNPAIAHEKHIPIFLSSYQASMSPCDLLILNLLRFYELKCEIDFFDYRPFLFGPTALAHFTSNDDQELKLMKKSVDDMNVVFMKLLNTFEKSIIENTKHNFPIKRQLAGVSAKDLDQFLVDVNNQNSIYDPGYFLPIFEMILATSNFNFTSLATKNNLISLILPALSSEDENMRLLAAHVLLKCRESNGKGVKDIWIRFYDSLQQGFGEITEGTKIDGKLAEKHFPRAASISTQLLAEFVTILPNSLHHAYGVVTNYLTVRDKFDFSIIPEMLVLFHSHEIYQEEQRLFILNVIFNGIKDDLDFKLLNNTPLLKTIFSCYGCPLSSRKIDLMILKIIDRIVTKTTKVDFMIQRYGLTLWVFESAVKVKAFEYDAIEIILTLIEHCFDAIQREMKTGCETSYKRLMAALLVLLMKFTKTKLAAGSFLSFIKTLNGMSHFSPINEQHYGLILDLMNVFLPDHLLQHITYIEKHPEACSFQHTKESFTMVLDPAIDDMTKKIMLESQDFMMSYHKK